tara:strand:+ start:37815 stop:39446 length:1632 start_codon:yes stop_codon:yes gene_type:complete
MSAAFLQLSATGQEDMYLTSNPEITFFKTTYKKHTNFAIDTVINQVSGSLDFGNDITCELPKNGDLISKLFLKIELSATTSSSIGQWGWIKNIGHNIIDTIKLQIGNRDINIHDNHWLNIWYELTKNENQIDGYNKLIGNTEYATKIDNATGTTLDRKITLFIPLHLYFTKEFNLALPIISLVYSKVNIIINLKKKNLLYNKTKHTNFTVEPIINSMTIITDYIHLDTVEKQYFSYSPLEYLIEQVQSQSNPILDKNMNISLPFNHMTKALFWHINSGKYTTSQVFLSNNLEIATKKFILGFFTTNDNTFKLGKIFTKINANFATIDFNIDFHINQKYRYITNKNNKNLKEIINSAYINKQNITNDNILLDDITVPELLPIEILSQPSNFFVSSSIGLFSIDVIRNKISMPVANIDSNYDIIYNDFSNTGIYIDGSRNPIKNNLIKLNGNNKHQKLPGNYFNYVQPYQHFLASPKDGLNCYSFSIKPCEYQPTGVCNFTHIKVNLEIELEDDYEIFNKTNIHIYALNYNKCKIDKGIFNLNYI